MNKIRFVDLFAGIGGFSLGLERAGMQCVGQVEIDNFCQAVLKKHWPNVPKRMDIKNVNGDEFGTAGLICGGFPCQPFSVAGKRRGANDDRYLWPEMFRIIKRCRPFWVLCENVVGIVNMELDKTISDLEGEDYETQSFIIPACSVDAQHRRDRIWIVANSDSKRFKKQRIEEPIKQEYRSVERYCRWPTEPPIRRVAHGVSNRVDRIKSLGNAVVPQIVEIIGRAIIGDMEIKLR